IPGILDAGVVQIPGFVLESFADQVACDSRKRFPLAGGQELWLGLELSIRPYSILQQVGLRGLGVSPAIRTVAMNYRQQQLVCRDAHWWRPRFRRGHGILKNPWRKLLIHVLELARRGHDDHGEIL